MDLTSLYYFSELAKDLHMTRTANRLFISQQTLSNHIQRLEKYYGTKLLYSKFFLEQLFQYFDSIERVHMNCMV